MQDLFSSLAFTGEEQHWLCDLNVPFLAKLIVASFCFNLGIERNFIYTGPETRCN